MTTVPPPDSMVPMFPNVYSSVQSITASVAKHFAKKTDIPKQTKKNRLPCVVVCVKVTMEDTIKSEPTYKTKISFSVESLLSSKAKTVIEEEEEQQQQDHLLEEDEEDEDITVDEDTEEDLLMEGRESASPSGAHTVLVPQPLHPSMPRLLTANPHHPQWPFSWMGHPAAIMRSGSPQSKLQFCFICL